MGYRIARLAGAPGEIDVLAEHKNVLVKAADRRVDCCRNKNTASAGPGRVQRERVVYLWQFFWELRCFDQRTPLVAVRDRYHLENRVGVKHTVRVQRQVEFRTFCKGLSHK